MRIPAARWPEVARTLYRTFGARGLSLRAIHEARRATGRFRSHPLVSVEVSEPQAIYRIDAEQLKAATDRQVALDRADRVLRGEYQAFRWDWRQLPSTSSGWLEHPVSRERMASAQPWWRIRHLDADFGDIKDLWEPARFAWMYDLVRAFVLTGDDRYAQAALEHICRWAESSPPFDGPHWSCGQESTIRATALLYAESNLTSAHSVDSTALALIQNNLAATGERVADAIGYAVSQRNNHALSEATGLILLGVRFSDIHSEADNWLGTGHRLLERCIQEQFAEDGWYIQHSFTYQRLALQQCVLAERALRSIGRGLNSKAVARIKASADLIATVIEPDTGIVPNHGASDGAYIHPVNLADYRDFRPVLTEVCSLWRHPMPDNVAVDEESLAWLHAPAPPRKDARKNGIWSGKSGWAVARNASFQVFLRAGRYESRPGHVDSLHVDLRVGSDEVLVDPGTFSYNAPAPWNNGLTGADVHNGPVLNDLEPGQRGPRFLWYLWPEARLIDARKEGMHYVIEAERPGEVKRRVEVGGDHVEIRDTALSDDAHTLRIRYLLHPESDTSLVNANEGEWHTSGENATVGWFSPYYGMRIPSRYLEILKEAKRHACSVVRIRVPSMN